MTTLEFKALALSFPGTVDSPHFDRTAFKIINKRIYATLEETNGMANIKFSTTDQAFFCEFDPKFVYPVPNKWGLQGWTTFELKIFLKSSFLMPWRRLITRFSGQRNSR